MVALSKNPRLIETKLADGVELAWYPDCASERRPIAIVWLLSLAATGYLIYPALKVIRCSTNELVGLPEVVVAYDRMVLGLVSVWLLIFPLAVSLLLMPAWIYARLRRSIFIRNGIVWFEIGNAINRVTSQTPFALTDIARIVVLRVDRRLFPVRRVDCLAADGKRLNRQRLPFEIIEDLAHKLSELSGIPIEYRKPGEPQLRAKN